MRLPESERRDDARGDRRETEAAREVRDAIFVEIGEGFGYLRNASRQALRFPIPVREPRGRVRCFRGHDVTRPPRAWHGERPEYRPWRPDRGRESSDRASPPRERRP